MEYFPTIAKQAWGYKPSPLSLFLSIALVWFGVMQGLQIRPAKTQILGTAIGLNNSEIIALTNLERQKQGLRPLQPDQKLMLAAEAKANDMVQFGYWDHYSPTKRPPWSFILDAGYDYHYAGENLAKDFFDSQKLVSAWMNSPAHRDNLLSPKYENTGVAVLQTKLDGKETLLVVQMFGTRFNPADYQAAQDRANGLDTLASGLLTPESSWSVRLWRPFVWTQLTALLVLGVVIIVLLRKWASLYRHRRPLTIHYWGHLMLLAMCGVLILMTSEGDIL